MGFKIIAEKEIRYGKDSLWLVLIGVADIYILETHSQYYNLGTIGVRNEAQGEVVLEVLEKKLKRLKDFYTACDLLCQGYKLLNLQAMVLFVYTRFKDYELYGVAWLREEFGFFTQPLIEDLICLKYREDKDIHVYFPRDVKPVGRFVEIKKENDIYYVFKLNPGYP